jgi:hypothetical protein
MIDIRRERKAWQGFESKYENIFQRQEENVGRG